MQQYTIEWAKRQMDIYGIPQYEYKRWREHRNSAKARGIEFRFTLLEWHVWWKTKLSEIGPHAKRGRGRDQYVMARIGDRGVYTYNNVVCASPKENMSHRPEEFRIKSVERFDQYRKERMQDPSFKHHLKIRGDGHPKSRAVITPRGRFGSAALAAEAFGITRQGAALRARNGLYGWSYGE